MAKSSTTISGKVPAPGQRPYDGIRALLKAGRNAEAIAALAGIVLVQPDDLTAKELLFDAFTEQRDFAPALALAEDLLRRQPESKQYLKYVTFTLSNMKRFPEAIAQAARYLEQHGEELLILDVLKVGCFYSGKLDEAVRYGQRGLEIRDAAARRDPPKMTPTAPTGRPGRHVISYSLWGTKPFYSYGAMINLVLSRTVYPGWTCRFYVDATVPRACVEFLANNGAEIFEIEKEYPGVGLFQRFLVMNDPTVSRFLVRDCDARLSAAEADLTNEWLSSDFPFHAIRDHVLHNELMIGCLWSGRTDCGIDIVELMRQYFTGGPTAKYGHDQRMLGLKLWPLIRDRCLVHDKYYTLPGVRTVPLRDPGTRLGAGHQNMPDILKELDRLGIPRVL
jgi:tetratricopeptide (TPR) repeat protein